MPNPAKSLIDLASIDLAYARLEVSCADQRSAALNRIGFHLDELKQHLSELARCVEGADSAVGEKTVARILGA